MQACIRPEYWGHLDNGNCYVMSVNGQWAARLSLKREPMAMISMVRRCARTIYLCDDGKDKKKKKFCAGLGSEVRPYAICSGGHLLVCTSLHLWPARTL